MVLEPNMCPCAVEPYNTCHLGVEHNKCHYGVKPNKCHYGVELYKCHYGRCLTLFISFLL